ncbi:MAG: universal stress protein [Bacteroidota bacterium]
MEIPEFAEDLYLGAKTIPFDEQIKQALQPVIAHAFTEPDFPVELVVREGNVTRQLLHWANIKQADMMIVGRKDLEFGTCLSIKKCMRQGKSSFFLVPPKPLKPVRRILVPTDYSQTSTTALRYVLQIARGMDEPVELVLLFVYTFPAQVHFDLLQNTKGFQTEIEEGARTYFNQYIRRIDTRNIQIRGEVIPSRSTGVARHIYTYAKKNDMDLIVMGAKGHNLFTSIMIGSVTEKLVSINLDIPMMVIRPES